MKILVTGANGQLGYDVCRELRSAKIEYCGTSSREMDVTNPVAVRNKLAGYRPDAVIHCAAYTSVDRAEDEPEKCRAVNVNGTRNIAAACKEFGSKLLYISTDYVFPGMGEKLYEPEDATGPLNVYGQAKLEGELAVKELLERYFIVRTSWVFGKNGSNFVKSMLRLAEAKSEVSVVCDQVGSPTYTTDLAPLLCDMVFTDKYGIYHATNEGTCSWAEFAQEIFRLAGKSVTVHPVTTSEYPTRAVRPLNSRLNKEKLVRAEFNMLPHWKDALARFFMKTA